MNKIKKGDEVIVIAGKDKNRRGVVLDVGKNTFTIDGINTVKKHTKPDPNKNEKGGVIIKNMPIHRSNVMLYSQQSSKGVRVGIKSLEDGSKSRYFKDNNESVDV